MEICGPARQDKQDLWLRNWELANFLRVESGDR